MPRFQRTVTHRIPRNRWVPKSIAAPVVAVHLIPVNDGSEFIGRYPNVNTGAGFVRRIPHANTGSGWRGF